MTENTTSARLHKLHDGRFFPPSMPTTVNTFLSLALSLSLSLFLLPFPAMRCDFSRFSFFKSVSTTKPNHSNAERRDGERERERERGWTVETVDRSEAKRSPVGNHLTLEWGAMFYPIPFLCISSFLLPTPSLLV